jgi:hypothetical protein
LYQKITGGLMGVSMLWLPMARLLYATGRRMSSAMPAAQRAALQLRDTPLRFESNVG